MLWKTDLSSSSSSKIVHFVVALIYVFCAVISFIFVPQDPYVKNINVAFVVFCLLISLLLILPLTRIAKFDIVNVNKFTLIFSVCMIVLFYAYLFVFVVNIQCLKYLLISFLASIFSLVIVAFVDLKVKA